MNFQRSSIPQFLLNFGSKTLRIKGVFPAKNSLKNLLILSLQPNMSHYQKFKRNGSKSKLIKMRIRLLVFKNMIRSLFKFGIPFFLKKFKQNAVFFFFKKGAILIKNPKFFRLLQKIIVPRRKNPS